MMNPQLKVLEEKQPDPPADPLGLEAWAASRGLGSHTALAIVSSILSAVAGNMFRFDLPASCIGAPGINLAGVDNDSFVAMGIADLTNVLAVAQRRLVGKAREFSVEEIDSAMFQERPAYHKRDFLERLGTPALTAFGIEDHSLENRMDKDMETSDQALCYERLVRPTFMFTGSLPADLTAALGGCHESRGLAAGCFESLPDAGSKRHRRVSDIISHLNGVSFTRESRKIRINESQETAYLRGVLLFPQPHFDWLIAERRDLLTNAIPITSSATAVGHEPQVDEILAARFLHRFQMEVRHALASRRSHSAVSSMFHSEAPTVEFLRRQRAFLRELQTVPESCRLSEAAKLPATMAWTLLGLAGKADLDDHIIETVFAAAHRLHADAVRMFREHDQADVAAQRLTVARKLAKRLTKLGPLKRRELVRGLDQQALRIHEPVIRVLIEMGIFIETPDRVLEIGITPLASLSAAQLIETCP